MVLGKRVEVSAPKLPASIGPLKVMTLPMASRPDWIAVKSLWPQISSGSRCWRATSPLPVDMRQQATGAVAAAHGEDDPVAAGQLGQLVNIGQPFMFSPGETLLPAGNDLLVGHLVSGLLQTLDAAGCRLLVDAIPGWRDQIKLRHDNSLL